MLLQRDAAELSVGDGAGADGSESDPDVAGRRGAGVGVREVGGGGDAEV